MNIQNFWCCCVFCGIFGGNVEYVSCRHTPSLQFCCHHVLLSPVISCIFLKLTMAALLWLYSLLSTFYDNPDDKVLTPSTVYNEWQGNVRACWLFLSVESKCMVLHF